MVSSFLSVTLFSGCSLSPFIEKASGDYNTTIEDVSNTSLVINVLRASDEAPLYFPDLSQVRGAFTASVSAQSTVPFGQLHGSTTRATAQGGPFSASTSPTFDIAPTNTKQFYQGIMNPVSENLFAYFVERFHDTKVMSYLFQLMVSSIEVSYPDGGERSISWRDGTRFNRLADEWTRGENLPKLFQKKASNNDDQAPTLRADTKAIVDAMTAGYDVKQVDGGVHILKKVSGSEICFYSRHNRGYVPIKIIANSVVKAPAGESAPTGKEEQLNGCGRTDIRGPRYALRLRSVEQIFYYLGALIDPDYPVKRQEGDLAGCPRIPFFISRTPVDHTRFSVAYRGELFYVADTLRMDSCGAIDWTMPTLAILNDLLNLSRDANETPSTKAVQAVPG